MRYSFLKTLVFLFAVILGVIFIDSKFFDRKLTDFGPAIVKKPMTYAVIKLENAGFSVVQMIDLEPHEEKHAMIVARK